MSGMAVIDLLLGICCQEWSWVVDGCILGASQGRLLGFVSDLLVVRYSPQGFFFLSGYVVSDGFQGLSRGRVSSQAHAHNTCRMSQEVVCVCGVKKRGYRDRGRGK